MHVIYMYIHTYLSKNVLNVIWKLLIKRPWETDYTFNNLVLKIKCMSLAHWYIWFTVNNITSLSMSHKTKGCFAHFTILVIIERTDRDNHFTL